MTLRDLARYRAKWRKPIVGTFRGRTLIGMPPPTSGGIAIQEWLNILEGYRLRKLGRGSADTLHLIAEAQKLAWADRNQYVGDPDFVRVPTRTLISKRYAARRRAEIDPQHAKAFGPGDVREARHLGSTTHLSVIDRKGDAVSVTCTIEQEFGSAVVAPKAGFLLNNEMTDFGKPGTANQSQAYKRPRSSMSPEIAVQGGRPIDVTGGAGGSTIISGTFWSLLNRIEFGLPLARAVDGPRLDAQQEPTGPMLIEDARYDPAVLAELERRGHTLQRQGEYAIRPRVQAAGFVNPRTQLKDAVSDPRTEAASLAQRRK
jgi:gamma-glutamyltranspeptidase/glutathione hydrolase